MVLVLREVEKINSSGVEGSRAIKSGWNMAIKPKLIRTSVCLHVRLIDDLGPSLHLVHVITWNQGFKHVQVLLDNFF